MGALFFLGLLVLISAMGLIALCFGLIQYIKRKKFISLIVSGVLLVIPLTLLIQIILASTVQRTIGFQRIGEYIEGGYQSEYFFIGNVCYHRFEVGAPGPFQVNNSDIVAYWEEYNSSGWVDCGNYYRVKNAMGFDLLCTNSGVLFCSSADLGVATTWYQDADNYCIFLQPDLGQDRIIPFPNVNDDVSIVFTLDGSNSSDTQTTENAFTITVPKVDKLPCYALLQISSDSVIELDRSYLYEYGAALYLSNAGMGHREGDQDMWTYCLTPIPQSISDRLLSAISSACSQG